MNYQTLCWFQIDVNSNLEKQGPLHVFLHKLTDTQSRAENGDKNVWKCLYDIRKLRKMLMIT